MWFWKLFNRKLLVYQKIRKQGNFGIYTRPNSNWTRYDEPYKSYNRSILWNRNKRFAATVAKTALWIAESQMFKETQEIINMHENFLPLKAYTHITEGNALRIEWNEVIHKEECSYIMGNPPFIGKKEQSREQKEELLSLFDKNIKNIGNIDYVAGWYKKQQII